MNAENTTTLNSPFCGELRSKKFFLLDALATRPEDYLDASNHCWCYRTQQTVGPDARPVSPRKCKPGRECYKSALAPAGGLNSSNEAMI